MLELLLLVGSIFRSLFEEDVLSIANDRKDGLRVEVLSGVAEVSADCNHLVPLFLDGQKHQGVGNETGKEIEVHFETSEPKLFRQISCELGQFRQLFRRRNGKSLLV